LSTYIGNTRWKKFKKLFIIAKSLVISYGLRYFIYVVKLELKKQGLSIFSPDMTPVPLYLQSSFKEKYQNFLQELNHKLEHESDDHNFSLTPSISILLFFDAKNIDLLQNTLDSIINQTYSKWEIVLVPKNYGENIPEHIQKIIKEKKFKISLFENNSKNLKNLLNTTGEYVGFLNAATNLSKFCLFEFIKTINNEQESKILYFDHDFINKNGKHENPFFKPDWSPYLLGSMNYLSPFFIIKNDIVKQINLDQTLKNCTDFDTLLQATEITKKITHIPLPLCSIKKQSPQNSDCFIHALNNHFKRLKINVKINTGIVKNTFKPTYGFEKKPKVSIIIPTKNNVKILKRCIDSITKKTNYKNFEIIIINNSDDLDTIKNSIQSISYNLISYPGNFNFSKINNLAVKQSSGDLLLFLNDDTKILEPNWLDELIGIILQKDVGIVGPKLILSDGTIQHAGIAFLKTGSGFHPFMRQMENSDSYHGLVNSIRDCSAVTGACFMIKREIFDQIEGFDDQFDVYYGDTDLCFKVIKAGYRVVYTPFTKLLHEGSLTIRNSNISHFDVENHLAFLKKWPHIQNGDPFYNTNLDWDYSLPEKSN